MRFVLTDSSLNRYGFRVLTSGVDISAFLKNPVMFYNHNRMKLPIGKWKDIKKEGDKITAEPEFDEKDEFAMSIKSKVEQGMLNSASIGFDVIEISEDPKLLLPGQRRPTVSKSEMFEASIADIPGNKNALKLNFLNGLTLSGDMPEVHLNNVLPILNPIKKMSKVALALGLPADATEEQQLAALTALTKKHEDNTAKVLVILGEKKGLKKETIEKLAKADFETTLSLIQETQENTVVQTQEEDTNKDKGRLSDLVEDARRQLKKDEEGTSGKGSDERASWTLRKWEKEDPAGLQNILSKEPKKYQKLFKDEHGYEPSLNELEELKSL